MLRRSHIAGRNLSRLFGLALFTVIASQAASEPVISQVSFPEISTVEQGTKVSILGSGFGTKEIAAPVLIDYVDTSYEYGVENDLNSNLADMSLVPTTFGGDKNAVWATSKGDFLYTTQGQHRHPSAGASYFFEGKNTWIGRPVSYGGSSGWDTPVDNSQLYVSWWYKNKYHSTWYWRFSPEGQVGQFEVDEELFIEGQEANKSQGVYVGIDDDGLHNAVLYNHRNTNDLRNVRIQGVSSGAETIFPEESRNGSGFGFEMPGSKLARVWDDPNGSDGIRSSVALHDGYASTAKMYYSLALEKNEWVHLEYEIDTEEGVLRLHENGRLLGEENFSPDAVYQGKYSPTLALLGTNGKQLKMQESWISEVYMDSSLQRVVIGNAPKYQDVTHREIQRPTDWSANEIEIALYLGALSFSQDLYVYVFDRDGVANSDGVPLCADDACPVPPRRIELKVN